MYLLRIAKEILVIIGFPVYWGLKFLTNLIKRVISNAWHGGKYLIAGSFLMTVTLGMVWFYKGVLIDMPNVNEIYNPPKLSTKILDRNGNLLYKFYEDENRSWTPLNKIPQSMVWATVAIEDKDFFGHHGLSIKGIFRALVYDLLNRGDGQRLRGGSTITQQLVKNVFFPNQNTWQRKIKEAILAVMIERKLTKEEILERYFNQVSYGGDTYGVEEASWKYFHKDVWDIDLAEAAFLAGLTAAPSSYSPTGSNPSFVYLRQKHVLEEMVANEFLSQEEADKALGQKLNIASGEVSIDAPHFVFYVKDYLEKKYGYQNFGRRGLVVTTSLDLEWQNKVEKIVKDEVDAVRKLNITNGSALVVNPKNGDILAMVGSKDYFAKDIDGKYNVTTASRQPGSSIKPINYLLALQKGWSLGSLVDDSPVVYQTGGQKPYAPQNYNGKYMGPVTLRTALASSLNIPSVKILASDGVSDMIDLAEKMGITTWTDRSRFGLALALGSGEVKMTDMATAYGIFANMGSKSELDPILEIKNYLGEQIYKKNPELKPVVDQKLAFMIDDALSDNQARSPIFGLNSKLKIEGKTVAVKTGTTNNLKDNWCIGWTPSVLVATWVGNNDDKPMSWVASGVTGATPIWNKIMSAYLANKPDEKWEPPLGVYKAKACGREDYFANGSEKLISCPVFPTPTLTP